mmetsp:Transcript_59923/g.141770  ORF Transcript_59923/g.141770 Transcript_59923/m.141770 type:complete len:302 (-) Transcript_59923:980-1885(-)
MAATTRPDMGGARAAVGAGAGRGANCMASSVRSRTVESSVSWGTDVSVQSSSSVWSAMVSSSRSGVRSGAATRADDAEREERSEEVADEAAATATVRSAWRVGIGVVGSDGGYMPRYADEAEGEGTDGTDDDMDASESADVGTHGPPWRFSSAKRWVINDENTVARSESSDSLSLRDPQLPQLDELAVTLAEAYAAWAVCALCSGARATRWARGCGRGCATAGITGRGAEGATTGTGGDVLVKAGARRGACLSLGADTGSLDDGVSVGRATPVDEMSDAAKGSSSLRKAVRRSVTTPPARE